MSNEILIALISSGAALLGSIIGAGATLLSIKLSRKVQEQGKITIFAKMVHSKSSDHYQMGFYGNPQKTGLCMRVPLWIDVVNTSGISRILRNVNLYAYSGKKEVAAFTQTQCIKDDGEKIILGDNESYTFVVPANSSRRFNVEFLLHESELSADLRDYDKLIMSYFDEKNIEHAFHFCSIVKSWVEGLLKFKSSGSLLTESVNMLNSVPIAPRERT